QGRAADRQDAWVCSGVVHMRSAIAHLRFGAVIAGGSAHSDAELGGYQEALADVLDGCGSPQDGILKGLVFIPTPTDGNDGRIVGLVRNDGTDRVDQTLLIEGGEID